MDKKLHDYEVFEENPLSKVWIVGTNPKDVSINPNKDKYNVYIANQHHYRENIDKLNRIWCEYCGMYYVWKNNLHSDFVGFCHYRRLIDVGKEEREKIKENNSIMYFSHIISYNNNINENYSWLKCQLASFQCPPSIIEDVIDFLDNQNYVSSDKIKDICNLEKVPFHNREIFYTTWDKFCDMMKFLNEYFEFIAKKYEIKSIDDWKTHVSEHIISYYKKIYPTIRQCVLDMFSSKYCYQTLRKYKRIFDEDEGYYQFCNCWRIYAYITEVLISLWISSHPKSRGNKMFEEGKYVLS